MALESGQRTGDAELWADLSGTPQVPAAEDELWSGLADQALAEAEVEATTPTRGRHAAGPADADGRDAAKQAETQAYEDAVKKAFGGKMGLADVGIPSLVFLVIYTATKQLTPALWGSIAVAVVLTIVRLFRKETLQHAVSGMLGVLVCAGVAKFSGRPQDYYLPGLFINVGYLAMCVVTAAVKWPVVGLMLGPITGEMVTWRQVPGRMRAFTMATWLLGAMFAFKLVVQVPLWMAGQTTALGIARLVMGYPLYLACLYVCWQIIKQAPPPLKPEPAEAESEAESV